MQFIYLNPGSGKPVFWVLLLAYSCYFILASCSKTHGYCWPLWALLVVSAGHPHFYAAWPLYFGFCFRPDVGLKVEMSNFFHGKKSFDYRPGQECWKQVFGCFQPEMLNWMLKDVSSSQHGGRIRVVILMPPCSLFNYGLNSHDALQLEG